MTRAVRPALFSGVLLLALYLRLIGLSWGVSDGGYGHDLNFQPDEFVSLRGVFQIDLLAGHIKAPEAYFEGTFNYYLWAALQAVLKLSGRQGTHLGDATPDYAPLLYLCRWMSVLFDLCTVVVLFLAIREATRKFYPSLLGALCYATLPMQVIYAHFMRTHVLSNLLCALVIWLSFKLRQSRTWQMFLIVGLMSGLGAATRYPVGLIVVIPCLYLLFNGGDQFPNWQQRAKQFATGPVWLIGLGFVIGLFIGHPMLFLDTKSIITAIKEETLKYASLHEFSITQLANLSVCWKYVSFLIPFAMYPLLWVVPYCAILYLLFRWRLYNLSAPILIFSLLYLYFMGKGYLGPYFARITMLLYPGFCVIVGLACSDLQARLRNKSAAAIALSIALLILLGLSVVFDIAYGRGMQQKDARQSLREDLRARIGGASARIGIWRFGPYFYTVMPGAAPLSSDKVTVRLQDATEDADFLLMGLPHQLDQAHMHAIISEVEAGGRFKYERIYRVPVKIFQHEFRLVSFPADMTYPFPTIVLFRGKASP